MKKLWTILALMLPSLAFAQWRVGVNGGADYNHFIIDKHPSGRRTHSPSDSVCR